MLPLATTWTDFPDQKQKTYGKYAEFGNDGNRKKLLMRLASMET